MAKDDKKGKVLSTDDLVQRATSQMYGVEGNDLEQLVSEMRMTTLLDMYEKGGQLEGEKLAKFKGMSLMQKGKFLQDNNYKLKRELADKFASVFAHELLRVADEDLAKSYDGHRKVALDPNADSNARAKAWIKMGNLNTIVQARFGFDVTKLAREGAKRGFSQTYFNQYTKDIGEGYQQMMGEGYTQQVTEAAAKKLIDKIAADTPNFDAKQVEAAGRDAMVQVYGRYKDFSKQGDDGKKLFERFYKQQGWGK